MIQENLPNLWIFDELKRIYWTLKCDKIVKEFNLQGNFDFASSVEFLILLDFTDDYNHGGGVWLKISS